MNQGIQEKGLNPAYNRLAAVGNAGVSQAEIETIRVSQIEDCMKHLTCAADELVSRISALAGRIEPILLPDMSEKEGHPVGQPAPPRAPLAAAISAIADRLDVAIMFINKVYTRVEV